MDLLEREDFLAQLGEYARDAAGGDSRVVLIAGEAGVGKTALVEAFAESTPDSRWLWGACDGSFTPQPLAPLLDIADQLGGELARVCRTPDAPRTAVFRLLRDQLTASDALTVLVFEDVHWADEASLDLIRFLSRRVRDCRVLILATYRDDALGRDHPLRPLLGEVGTHRWARRISLPSLTQAAVATLANEHGADAAGLYQLTGGNPFYVREALASSGDQLLTSVHDAVQARICRLSPDARSLVDWVSVLGSSAHVDDLSRLGASADAVMDECLASGALVASGDVVRFRHELARAAIESSLPEHRRRAMHAAVLVVMVQRGEPDAARLAHHADGAQDAVAVLEYASLAGEQAAHLGSHREAAVQFERTLRWAGKAEPGRVASWLDRLADEYGLLDQWERSAELRERAVHTWDAIGDRRRQSLSLRKLSHAQWRLCDGERQRRYMAETMAVLDGEPPCAELGWALNLNASHLVSQHPDEAGRLARQAVELAEQFSDTALLSEALNTEGCSLWYRGEDGGPLLRQSLDVAIAGGHEYQIGRALSNLHSYLLSRFRFADAEAVFGEAQTFWDMKDFSTYEACQKGGHIRGLDQQGRWDEVLAIGRELVTRAREHLSPVNRLNPLQAVGRVLARRGDPEGAQMLGEALSLARSLGDSDWLADALIGSTELAWLRGEDELAQERGREAVDLLGSLDPDFAAEAAVWTARVGVRVDGVTAPRTPFALALSGEHRAAAAQLDAMGMPYDAALVLLDSRDPEAMREATQRLDALGATVSAARARQLMREQGVTAIPRGSRASTKQDPLGLTTREREVLTLVCDGASNAEIAQALVLSPKTVDHHVSAILGKLGVASRGDAAQVALGVAAAPEASAI